MVVYDGGVEAAVARLVIEHAGRYKELLMKIKDFVVGWRPKV